MDLPLYDITLNGEEQGMFKVSIVDKPAIMEGFLAFNNDSIKFEAVSEEKKQVVGPLLIPDQPIYRRNEQFGEYYVRFSADTIEQILYKYSKDGFFNLFNLEHQYDTDAVVMLEMWIKESDIDKSDEYGFDLPVGTLFMKAQIEDESLWGAIKDKEFNGFSIEIKADIKKVEEKMTEFQFGEAFGAYKADMNSEIISLKKEIETLKEDNLQLMETLMDENFAGVKDLKSAIEMIQKHIESMDMVKEEEEQKEEKYSETVEEVQEEVSEQLAEEEAPAEEVAEEVAEEAVEEEAPVEEVQEELSEEEAELALSAEQEEVAEQVEEPKALEFKQINKTKVSMIDSFFGKRLY